jgi:hypothetical protein
MLSAKIDAQVRLDERVSFSFTQCTILGDILMVNISVKSSLGPFKLTLAINLLNGNLSVLSAP